MRVTELQGMQTKETRVGVDKKSASDILMESNAPVPVCNFTFTYGK
jgi:hypothetical protein